MNRFNTRGDIRKPLLCEHSLVGLIITISVEDNLEVLLECLPGNVFSIFTGINAVSELLELLSTHSVEDSVNHRHILGRADRTEFEASTTVWEGGRTVTIFGGCLDGTDVFDSKVKINLFGAVSLDLALRELLEIGCQIFSKVGGDDGRRRFHSTKTEIISWTGNGHPHQIAMLVNCGNHSSHDDGECHVVASSLVDWPSKEEGHVRRG
mmetsp:Transcript_4066/g.10323  ORF Transcript_4066/g.10323 Transcript_4066/m.10323 type:complete len:209 (-) Transcript_4066:1188-1814(-)